MTPAGWQSHPAGVLYRRKALFEAQPPSQREAFLFPTVLLGVFLLVPLSILERENIDESSAKNRQKPGEPAKFLDKSPNLHG